MPKLPVLDREAQQLPEPFVDLSAVTDGHGQDDELTAFGALPAIDLVP